MARVYPVDAASTGNENSARAMRPAPCSPHFTE